MMGQPQRGAVGPPLCLRQILPPRIFGAKMKLDAESGIGWQSVSAVCRAMRLRAGRVAASGIGQPVQNLVKPGCGAARGQGWTVDHDDGQAQLPRGDQLGAGPRATGILADDPGYAMLHKKRRVALKCEGAAIDQNMVVGQRWRRLRRIDQTQKIVMLWLRGKTGQMHAPDGQQDTLARAAKGRNRSGDIGDMGPVIALFGGPCRAGEGDKRRARGGSGLHGMFAHLRCKRMGRVDQMGDGLFAQVARQPLWPAKATAADRNRLRSGARHAACVAEGRGQARLGQGLHQSRGLGRAAKDKDVVHG